MGVVSIYEDTVKARNLVNYLIEIISPELIKTVNIVAVTLLLFDHLKFLNKIFGLCISKLCENKIDECAHLKKNMTERIEIVSKIKKLENIIKDICTGSLYFTIWYKLAYKKYFTRIYENHEDVYSLLQSYEAEDGEFVSSKELLAHIK